MQAARTGRKIRLAVSILLGGLTVALALALPLGAQEAPEVTEGTRALYRNDYGHARALAAKYLEAHPEDSSARILLARAEIARGQYEPAYEALQKALDSDPSNVDALYYLERLSTVLSQIQFQQLLAIAPGSWRAHQLLADSYLAQEHNGEAEREYQAALAINPQSVEILDALGELKRSEFKFDEALNYYGRAAKLAPRDYTSAYGIGACELYKQDPQRAIGGLRRAVAIDPRSAAAHLALGDALLRAGQTAAAVVELKAAIALIPRMRQAYTLLARAYQKLGQSQEAERALLRERELAQEDIGARQGHLTPDSAVRPPGPP